MVDKMTDPGSEGRPFKPQPGYKPGYSLGATFKGEQGGPDLRTSVLRVGQRASKSHEGKGFADTTSWRAKTRDKVNTTPVAILKTLELSFEDHRFDLDLSRPRKDIAYDLLRKMGLTHAQAQTGLNNFKDEYWDKFIDDLIEKSRAE